MNRTTYNDLVENYFPKDGEPADQDVFFRTPAELKTELDNIGDRFDIIQGIDPDDWDSTYTYKIGDIVKYGAKYYEAINVNLNSLPNVLTDWVEITPIANIQEQLVMDNTPTDGSLNPVTSDGIFEAFNDLETSGTVYNATLLNNLDDSKFMRTDENTGTSGTLFYNSEETMNATGIFNDYINLPGTGVTNSIEFNSTGTKLYTLNLGNNKIYELDVSTPFDIKTAVYNNINISTQNTSSSDMTFKPDGTKLYEIASNIIYEYTLSTAWDLSTASYLGIYKSTYTTSNVDIKFNSAGTILYITNSSDGLLHVYTLSTAWDLSTITHTTNTIPSSPTSINGLHFKSDGAKLYILNSPISTSTDKLESSWWWCDTCNYRGASSSVTSLLHSMLPIVQASGGTYIEIYYTVNTVFYVRHNATAPFYIQLGGSTTNRDDILTINPGQIFYLYQAGNPYIKDYYGNISGGGWDKPSVYTYTHKTSVSYDINTSGEIWEYDLSTPWDVTTATLNDYTTIQTEDIYSLDIDLTGNGDFLYLSDMTSNRLHQYPILTAFDIMTVDWGYDDEYKFTINGSMNGATITLKDNNNINISQLYFKNNGKVQLNGKDIIYDNGHMYDNNGYQKLSSGLILQWGKITGAGSLIFPITFTVTPYSVTLGTAGGGGSDCYITALSKTGFTLAGVDSGESNYYIAVGV